VKPASISAGASSVAFSAGTAAAAALGAPRWVWIALAIFAAVSFLVAVVAGYLAYHQWRVNRPTPPNIEIGQPRICFRGEAGFVRLPIANEGGDPAESVHARARVVDEPDRWLPLTWVLESPQVPQGGHAWQYESEAPEATLKPNGRPVWLQIVGQHRGKEFCGFYTPDSFWEIPLTWPFEVEVDLRGSNVERRFRFRVTPDEGGLQPKAELIGDA
jgi:hypothetical protein